MTRSVNSPLDTHRLLNEALKTAWKMFGGVDESGRRWSGDEGQVDLAPPVDLSGSQLGLQNQFSRLAPHDLLLLEDIEFPVCVCRLLYNFLTPLSRIHKLHRDIS